MKKQISLGPYQDRVVNHLNTKLAGSYVAENLPRSLHQPYLDENGDLQNVLRRSCGAYSTSDLLLESLGFNGVAGERHLDLALHHLSNRIESSAEDVVAHCQDLVANQPQSYRAKHLVLCCGCVESPRLAKQSGLTDPNNNIGQSLTDHPAYFYDRWHDLPNSGDLHWLGVLDGHAKILLRSTNPTDEPFNIELLINASYWDSRFADPELWDRSKACDAKVEIKFIFDSPLDHENYIETKGEGRKPWIRVKPNHHGKQFQEKIVKARNTILTQLGIPMADLSTAWDKKEWRPGYNGSVQHAGGSMRMSDDGTGVVDENLRLLAYNNIYCCDPSVLPSIPAANPSLTVVALALRLAKHLKDKVES